MISQNKILVRNLMNTHLNLIAMNAINGALYDQMEIFYNKHPLARFKETMVRAWAFP